MAIFNPIFYNYFFIFFILLFFYHAKIHITIWFSTTNTYKHSSTNVVPLRGNLGMSVQHILQMLRLAEAFFISFYSTFCTLPSTFIILQRLCLSEAIWGWVFNIFYKGCASPRHFGNGNSTKGFSIFRIFLKFQ